MGANFIPNLGFEPKVVGYTFFDGFKPNSVSPGIKGMGGVYYIMLLNRVSLPDDPQANMKIAQQRYQQEMQLKNAIGQMLQQTITRTAKVRFNPDNF